MQKGPKVLITPESTLQLHNTPPEKGQEWCAFTYLLVPEPKTSTYGTVKILCFGSTDREVEAIVGEMMKSGELERSIPFVQVVKTGHWRKLVAGGEKSDVAVTMNAMDGTILSEVHKERARRNADATRELDEQMRRVKEESEGKNFETPYEEYCRFRTQITMAVQRERQLEQELKQVKQARGNGITKVRQIEREYGTFRLKFDKEYKVQKPAPEIQQLEDTLPEGYQPPAPWVKHPSVEHGDISGDSK
jgi:hypothetical protein